MYCFVFRDPFVSSQSSCIAFMILTGAEIQRNGILEKTGIAIEIVRKTETEIAIETEIGIENAIATNIDEEATLHLIETDVSVIICALL